jgi:hypothetical protein
MAANRRGLIEHPDFFTLGSGALAKQERAGHYQRCEHNSGQIAQK